MKIVWFLIILSVCLSVKCAIADQITANYFVNFAIINKSDSKINNVCPDHIHQCYGNQPCCRTPRGIVTCCPYPYGTCCADGRHCCPYGMFCYTNTTCKANNIVKNFNIETLPVPKINDIVCKDGHKCLDGMTCCQMTDESWGCCLMSNATCCPDKIHCCPHGYKCDISGCHLKT